jgi:hypothetical protein
MTDGPITLQGVAFPMRFAHDPTEFITPDWRQVVEFYPEFLRVVMAREDIREEPWDPQPYLLTFAKYLERRKAREGRTADDWMKRLVEHFGLPWFMAVVEDMNEAKKEAWGDG